MVLGPASCPAFNTLLHAVAATYPQATSHLHIVQLDCMLQFPPSRFQSPCSAWRSHGEGQMLYQTIYTYTSCGAHTN